MNNLFDPLTESCDDFLNGHIKLIQPLQGYRSGVDPLLLASSLPPLMKGNLLDLGCGSGILGLCAAYHHRHIHVTAMDQSENAINRTKRNAKLNHMENRFEAHIYELGGQEADPIPNQSMDIVLTNPPWFHSFHSQKAQGERGDGRQEDFPLHGWISYAQKKLKPKGLLGIIHRTYRLNDILKAMDEQFGNIKIIPIYSQHTKPAKNIILLAHKGRKTPLEIYPPLVIYEENGDYSEKLKKIQQL